MRPVYEFSKNRAVPEGSPDAREPTRANAHFRLGPGPRQRQNPPETPARNPPRLLPVARRRASPRPFTTALPAGARNPPSRNPWSDGSRACAGVSEGGLEPPRPCGHQPLKLARLPIPPLRRANRLKNQRPEIVARPRRGTCYCPGRDGVVLLVDSACRTAQ